MAVHDPKFFWEIGKQTPNEIFVMYRYNSLMYSRRLLIFSNQKIFKNFELLDNKLRKIKEHLNNFANFGENLTKNYNQILENLLKL